MNSRKIVKLVRKYHESKLQWYISATYSDGAEYVPNSGLTEKGSKGCLTKLAKVYGLMKISTDLAVRDDANVNVNVSVSECTDTKENEAIIETVAQQSEIVEKAPLPIDYKFYLFSELVNDLMINLNSWHIPHDIKFPIIMEAYERFCEEEGNEEYEGGLHEFTHSWINNDETMYSDLRDSADS